MIISTQIEERLTYGLHKSFNTKPCHHLCNMAIDEDEKEIPQEEKLVEETEAVDEEENDDIERGED
jgi:hypothetical protein